MGTLEKKNTYKRFKINGELVNFIVKFAIDEGTTKVSLNNSIYDTSPDADYDSWFLLESKTD